MEKNKKARVIIHSIEELRPSQRKQLKKASVGMGLLVVLIYGLLLWDMDGHPHYNHSWFFYCMDWMMIIGFGFASFVLGYNLGFYMQMKDFGIAFPKRHQLDFYQSPPQSFSSSDGPSHTYSSTYNASTSINPSSGQPMSGSSGVDTSGNPYGTRSW